MKKLFLLLFTCFLLNFFYSANLHFSLNYNDDNYYDYMGYGNEKYNFFSASNFPDYFDTQLSLNIEFEYKIFKNLLEIKLELFEKTFQENDLEGNKSINYMLGMSPKILFFLSKKVNCGLKYKIRWFPDEKHFDYDKKAINDLIAELWFIDIGLGSFNLHFGGEVYIPNHFTVNFFPWDFLGLSFSLNGFTLFLDGEYAGITDFTVIIRKNNITICNCPIKYIEINVFFQHTANRVNVYGLRLGGKI